MSRHVTYRGTTVDMEALFRENEKTVAVGNMPVNARGDKIKGKTITKTADQIARENHRVQSAIVNTGLKGPAPSSVVQEPVKPTKTRRSTEKVSDETELPNGDIILNDKK